MPRRRSSRSSAMKRLIAQRVAKAITAYEANRNNGAGLNDGAEANNTADGVENTARGCSYKEFLNCKPRTFDGTEGAVGLVRWFEKLESVFRICNCTENCKVKYATCTLQDAALTWWNAYAQSIGIDAAYLTTWEDLKRMMTEEYCPRNELQKLEVEFWNLTVKGNDISGYTNRFHELALLCPTMVTPEYKKIERYIWGLAPEIQGNVTSSKPTKIQEAIRMAHDLTDQVVRQGANAVKNADNKRKWEGNSGRNSDQQNKRVETAKAAGSETSRGYIGNKPYCNKCNSHHTGPCGDPCEKCKRYGHQTKDCRNPNPTANNGAPGNCFECGKPGHFKKDCPKLKNQDDGKARGRAYVLAPAEGY